MAESPFQTVVHFKVNESTLNESYSVLPNELSLFESRIKLVGFKLKSKTFPFECLVKIIHPYFSIYLVGYSQCHLAMLLSLVTKKPNLILQTYQPHPPSFVGFSVWVSGCLCVLLLVYVPTLLFLCYSSLVTAPVSHSDSWEGFQYGTCLPSCHRFALDPF